MGTPGGRRGRPGPPAPPEASVAPEASASEAPAPGAAAAPGPGSFAELVGMRREAMAEGRGVWSLEVRPDHLNAYGVVHGGVVYALADQAMGAALVSRLEPGERCATVEIKVQYLGAVTGGTLRAEARLVGRTRRLGVLEGRVLGDGDRLVALATGTFYIQRAGA